MRKLFLFLLLILCPTLSEARGIVPQLVAEGPAPPGGEVELAIHMRPAVGWHGYWLNPGDAGLPMDVQWKLPNGFTAGSLRYPVPTRLKVAGLMNYVFEHDYAVLVRLKVPADARETVPIRAQAHWLACTDKICVPEQGELSLDLPVGKGAPNRAEFDSWRTKLEQPLATIGHFAAEGDSLRVAIPLPASARADEPYLFPITDHAVDYEAPQSFRRAGDWVVADLKMKNLPEKFSGVLALGDGRGLEFQAVPGSVPSGGNAINSMGWKVVLFAVLGAIAGGVLLNLMPCVFPILALKALHISKERLSAPARSERFCSRSGRRARKPVGPSSCRIRAPSCYFCCWRLPLRPTFWNCSNCLCSAVARSLREALERARLRHSSRRLAPVRSSGRRLALHCCFLQRGLWPSLPH